MTSNTAISATTNKVSKNSPHASANSSGKAEKSFTSFLDAFSQPSSTPSTVESTPKPTPRQTAQPDKNISRGPKTKSPTEQNQSRAQTDENTNPQPAIQNTPEQPQAKTPDKVDNAPEQAQDSADQTTDPNGASITATPIVSTAINTAPAGEPSSVPSPDASAAPASTTPTDTPTNQFPTKTKIETTPTPTPPTNGETETPPTNDPIPAETPVETVTDTTTLSQNIHPETETPPTLYTPDETSAETPTPLADDAQTNDPAASSSPTPHASTKTDAGKSGKASSNRPIVDSVTATLHSLTANTDVTALLEEALRTSTSSDSTVSAANATTQDHGSATNTAANITNILPPTDVTNSITHRAETTPAAQELPPIQQEQLLDQVVLGLRAKFDAKSGQAEIKLEPPNLGALHVSVKLNNGTLTAQFESSNDMVRDLLSSHMDQLRSVLQDQGINVDRLAVKAGDQVLANSNGSAQHDVGNFNQDGRSAGEYAQNSRQQQRHENPGQGFADVWQQLQDEKPLDLVA